MLHSYILLNHILLLHKNIFSEDGGTGGLGGMQRNPELMQVKHALVWCSKPLIVGGKGGVVFGCVFAFFWGVGMGGRELT